MSPEFFYNRRADFLRRHRIDSLLVEMLVYLYYFAFTAFWVIAILLFAWFLMHAPALTIAVFTTVGVIIYARTKKGQPRSGSPR